MARLDPLNVDDLNPESRVLIEAVGNMMGFTPNDALIMARSPDLMKAVSYLVSVIYSRGRVDPGLKRLIGHITSTAAGCVYCQAHTAHGASRLGVDPLKLEKVWEYQTSELFTEAEKAALRVAQGAGLSPSGVTNFDFRQLKQFYDEDEIIEIVSVIALFGFLNRWNATLATDLEEEPAKHLSGPACR